jgi:hypothetical protein
MNTRFDDLRPYHQSEIAPAMLRIADSEYLPVLANYVFPEKKVDEVRDILRNIRTTDEFQRQVMYYFNKRVLHNSAGRFVFDGTESLDPEKCYLFVSNHRDIMLDSALMQYGLYLNGFRTTEITFGSNLMSSQLIVDIGKANKMFKVIRGGNIRDFYNNSMHLSEYIRYTITEKKESIWIAQRNGRTKNGNDATDQGIVKMFCMSDPSGPIRSLDALNIVPVAISYRIEPCDVLKTRELYLSREGRKYVKQAGEDQTSILTGILQPKGDIHIRICEPLRKEELTAIPYRLPNEFHKAVASLIDRRIHKSYKLHDNNYIAHDIRSGRETYAAYYTPAEKAQFVAQCERMLQQVEGNKYTLMSIYLGIYANPVDNRQKS